MTFFHVMRGLDLRIAPQLAASVMMGVQPGGRFLELRQILWA
jgi:hypothetical protein